MWAITENVWEALLAEIPEMKNYAAEHFDCWADTEAFAQKKHWMGRRKSKGFTDSGTKIFSRRYTARIFS